MSSFHHVVSEKQAFTVEGVGDHEYLVRVHGGDEDAADFPAIVEIEDVLASYPDYRSALTG